MLYAYLTALLLAAMAPFHALACNHIGVIKADYSNFDDCENTCPGLVREPLCFQILYETNRQCSVRLINAHGTVTGCKTNSLDASASDIVRPAQNGKRRKCRYRSVGVRWSKSG